MHADIAHLGQNLIRIHAHVMLASHTDVISTLHATLNLVQIRDIRMHSGYEFFAGCHLKVAQPANSRLIQKIRRSIFPVEFWSNFFFRHTKFR